MIYLRECPFCGAEVRNYTLDHALGYNRALRVYCHKCGVSIDISEPENWDNVREGKKFDAVERWNNRDSDKVMSPSDYLTR